nr:MAG TPA: hypothetical protein [Caudoviricetes sp.]
MSNFNVIWRVAYAALFSNNTQMCIMKLICKRRCELWL